MYPSLRMTKPEPVPLPLKDSVEMETTDGRTRAAIPAIEVGARSTVEVDDTNCTD